MDWPHELEIELTAMAQGGDAVGRYKGRAVFASGGLPGELVRVRLHDRQKQFARGRVVAVQRAAPERIASPCPLEAVCSAADWRWISYEAQRRFKAEILRDQFKHIGGLEVEVALDRPAAAYTADPRAAQAEPARCEQGNPLLHGAYRTTADLHVDGARLGYYAPGSRRVADVPACCLHHPLINEALAALRPLPTGGVELRAVSVRCDPRSGEVLGSLDGRGALRELAQAWSAAYSPLVGVVQGRTGRALAGQNWLLMYAGSTPFHVSAHAFFQINWRQRLPLLARVRELLDLRPDLHLLDLFCGVGLFALSYAPDVAAVVGIEEWEPAVADARRSAKLNQLNNVTFRAGRAEDMLASLDGAWERVVLDPPRRGAAPEMLHALIEHAPARIVYVSCHPGTLARDCKLLCAAGYCIASAEPIDMFPYTHHVESIVCLDRA